MKLVFFFLLPSIVFAGFNALPEKAQYEYKEKNEVIAPVKAKKIRKVGKSNEMSHLMNDLLKSESNIESLLKGQEKNLIVRKKEDKIRALTRVKGVLLNSILAMNIKPTTFVVKIKGDELGIEDAELRCLGMSFQKRVPAKCDLLVSGDSEFKVDVSIWDLDGAEGIIADYVYSGEEKTFLTSSFASFFEGVLDAAKDRIVTPFGEATRNNGKNKILGGLTNIAQNTNNLVKESGEKNLSIAFVNSGKDVLIFFNQSLTLTEEDK